MKSASALLPQRILIIKLRHHGDMLLTTPVISTLKQRYPQAEIDVLLYQETREMLTANPQINRIFTIDRQWKKQGLTSHLSHEWGLLRQLRARKYQLVVNLADQWRSGIVTRWTGASVRLGFDFPKRRDSLWQRCHTSLVPVTHHEQLHTVMQNLSLLAPLGIGQPSTQVTMSYDAQDWQQVQKQLQKNQISSEFIVVQPTSRWLFKCWSEEKMAVTLRALQDDGHTIVLTSSPEASEREMVRRILSACDNGRAFSLAGELTLRQLAAIIDHAKLFIGVDSVPMHMAAALGTPCVALFGPSKLAMWHPWQSRGVTLWAGDYGPLPDPDEVDTKTDIRYLDILPADVVIQAAKECLK